MGCKRYLVLSGLYGPPPEKQNRRGRALESLTSAFYDPHRCVIGNITLHLLFVRQ
jgi:hypothetical protein